jgi:hypothetical protein
MDRIDSHIDFVKSQIEFQERQATRFAGESRRAALHTTSAERFKLLLIDLESLRDRLHESPDLLSAGPSEKRMRISLSWEEIDGLPPELLAELSISESDKAEFTITSIISELGGVASLDRIIVALFRQTGEITKRAALNQRLYRMVQKEMVYSVPGKKGVYSTRQISDEEATKLN